MSAVVSPIREPLINGSKSYHDITEDICAPTEGAPNPAWVLCLAISFLGVALFGFCVFWTVYFGIGTWNLNRTINWSWDITNFVWWIGIGHAGEQRRQ